MSRLQKSNSLTHSALSRGLNSPASRMATSSIFSRPIDLLYLIFFTTHIPLILCKSQSIPELTNFCLSNLSRIHAVNDITPLYPASIRSSGLSTFFTTDYYIALSQDRFFLASPPAWFTLYQVLEAVFQIPLCLWLSLGLVQQDVTVPAGLLLFAVQCSVTTATCLADIVSWEAYDK